MRYGTNKLGSQMCINETYLLYIMQGKSINMHYVNTLAAAIITQSVYNLLCRLRVINHQLVQKTADPYSCYCFNIPACIHYAVEPF